MPATRLRRRSVVHLQNVCNVAVFQIFSTIGPHGIEVSGCHTSSDAATQWLRELPDIANLDPEFVYRGTFPKKLYSHNSSIISRGSLSLSSQSSSISVVTTFCTEHRFEDISHRIGTLASRLVLSTGECSFVVAPCPLFSLETRIVSCEQSDEPLTLTHTTH